MTYVRANQHAGDIGIVCLEGGYRDEGGDIAILDHPPDVDVALGNKLGGRFSWCN